MKALLLLLAKGGLGKLVVTAGSMLVSIGAYALAFGWRYAVGFVLLLLVHEMGHFVVARQRGLSVGAPVFIPFVGAWVALKQADLDPETEAHVAMAGPMLGSVAAFTCYLWALAMHERLFMALAQAGFMLNLFNLLPLAPLDGGRVVGTISPRLWLVGAPMLAALLWWRPSPLLLLVALMAAPQFWAAVTGRTKHLSTLGNPSDKLRYGAMYLGLSAALAVLAFEAHSWLASTAITRPGFGA